jgi:putative addiction module antidote
MPARFRIKIVKVGNSLRITIPQPIAEGFGLAAGDTVIIETRNNEIVVKKEKATQAAK